MIAITKNNGENAVINNNEIKTSKLRLRFLEDSDIAGEVISTNGSPNISFNLIDEVTKENVSGAIRMDTSSGNR